MLRYLTPRWIFVHIVVVAACVGCLFAARWQWTVAEHRHAMRNYAYTVQWIFFCGFGLWFWTKVMRDAHQPEPTGAHQAVPAPSQASAAPTYRGYTMPQSGAITTDDPELVRYNEYLSALSGADQPDIERTVHTEGRQ